MSIIEKTIISDRNIHDLVNKYIDDKSSLPPDLQNVHIGDWDVSNVTNMRSLFQNKETFNEPLDNWDVRKVTDMGFMFDWCLDFNHPLENWIVSKVTNMESMFRQCENFDQPLEQWDVSKVTNMENMFQSCLYFNQPLDQWDVSKVTNMFSLFEDCREFNQPLPNWKVSNVVKMHFMFSGCYKYDEPLNTWNVGKVRYMTGMFQNCEEFDQPLDNWNVSSVENMSSMFTNCYRFNQPLGRWNISRVTDMASMFFGCRTFNQPLNTWIINNVYDTEDMFEDCPIEEQNKPVIDRTIPQVDATQIHREFAKINCAKLNDFLSEKLTPETHSEINAFFTDVSNNSRYPTFINNTILKMINENDEPEDVKQRQREGLNRIMEERLNQLRYSDFSGLMLKSIVYTLHYVMAQPKEFQKIYVETFIKECVHAYEGPNGMSCAAGALERIVYSLINPSQTMLTTNEIAEYAKYSGREAEGVRGNSRERSSAEFETIIAILVANPEKLIPEYIQDWYKLHKTGSENAFPAGTSVEDKKADLRRYLLQSFPDEGDLIDAKIVEFADNIGYDDDNFMYGGRRRKPRKTHKGGKKTKKTLRKTKARKTRHAKNKKTKRTTVSRKTRKYSRK